MGQYVATLAANYWANVALLGALGLVGLLVLLFLARLVSHYKYTLRASYFILVTAAAIFCWQGSYSAYSFAFLLGLATAFAEIIGKFGDEPTKALLTPHALLYHLANGLIAAVTLQLLKIFGVPMTSAVEQVKAVAIAGFGSMLVMRSKLFDVKVGDQDLAVGPEEIIRVFFRFMEDAIDRGRRVSRIDFVTATMDAIDFGKVYDYAVTMLAAPQTLTHEQVKDLKREIDAIHRDHHKETQLKSYELAFCLSKVLGEIFVAKLFDNPQEEWLFKARKPPEPAIVEPAGGFVGRVFRIFAWVLRIFFSPKEEEEYYFAYGLNTAVSRLFEGLGRDTSEKEMFLRENPRPCRVKGFRAVFNKPFEDDPSYGRINIEFASPNDVVEGVLYKLPRTALSFVYRYDKGYRPMPITVELNRSKLTAQTLIAAEPTRQGLKPKKEYLDELVTYLRENGLSDDYIQQLSRQAA